MNNIEDRPVHKAEPSDPVITIEYINICVIDIQDIEAPTVGHSSLDSPIPFNNNVHKICSCLYEYVYKPVALYRIHGWVPSGPLILIIVKSQCSLRYACVSRGFGHGYGLYSIHID